MYLKTFGNKGFTLFVYTFGSTQPRRPLLVGTYAGWQMAKINVFKWVIMVNM
jgi:hypothetical protein